MRTVTIRAIEAVQSIRAGTDDVSLMEKFDISIKGLHTLFKQLVAAGLMQRSELEDRMSLSYGTVVIDPNRLKWPEKRTKKLLINAEEALNCIRSGMSETALMRKYHLSTKGLQSLFNKLLRKKLIGQTELDGRISSGQTAFLLDEQAVYDLEVDPPDPDLAAEDILSLNENPLTLKYIMILRGYDPGRCCVSTMLGIWPYFSLLHFKEARTMRMAHPGSISQQPKGTESLLSRNASLSEITTSATSIGRNKASF